MQEPTTPTDIQAIPDKALELPEERVIAYFYKDKQLEAPLPVYDARAGTWWMDGGINLYRLMERFKMHDTVKQACYLTGISREQYLHFHRLHPWFIPLIRVYKSLPAIKLKEVILRAAIGDEKNGIEGNAKIALGAYRIFDDPEDEPELLGVQSPRVAIPEGGSVLTTVKQAFLNEEGKLVMSRQMAERVTKHGGEEPN